MMVFSQGAEDHESLSLMARVAFGVRVGGRNEAMEDADGDGMVM